MRWKRQDTFPPFGERKHIRVKYSQTVHLRIAYVRFYLIFITHFCRPFYTTLLRDGKGPSWGAPATYPVSWLITSGAQSMHGDFFFIVFYFILLLLYFRGDGAHRLQQSQYLWFIIINKIMRLYLSLVAVVVWASSVENPPSLSNFVKFCNHLIVFWMLKNSWK